MEKILFVIIILMVNCSGIKSQSKDNELKHRFKIVKIDSTKTMYLIQVQNENIKEVIITEKECKSKDMLNKKIVAGNEYLLKVDPLDSYFNDDDFQKSDFKVDDVDVKPLTEGKIYLSNSLCGLFVIE